MIYTNNIGTLPPLSNSASPIQDKNKLLTHSIKYSNSKQVLSGKGTLLSEMQLLQHLMSTRHKPQLIFDFMNKTTPFQEFERLKKENKEVINRRKKVNSDILSNYLYQIKKLHIYNNKTKQSAVNFLSEYTKTNSFSFHIIRNNALNKSNRIQLIKEKNIVNEFLNKPLIFKTIGLKLKYSKQNKDCGSQTETS